MTENADVAIAFLRSIYAGWNRRTTIAQMAADWDAAFAKRAQDWPRSRFKIGEIEAEWIAPPDQKFTRSIIFFHGGGFRIGSIESHRDLMQRLSLSARANVLGVDYRLGPEHGFPAPLEDACAVYDWALGEIAPENLALAGDSAGGGLAASLMLRAQANGQRQPACAYLMSPWLDMTASGASYTTRAGVDPIHQRAMILNMAQTYLGQTSPRDPYASPLFGQLQGLPPLLVQGAGRDIILDDGLAFVARAQEAGVEAQAQTFESMIHVFQAYGELASATTALAAAGAFFDRHMHRGQPQDASKHTPDNS